MSKRECSKYGRPRAQADKFRKTLAEIILKEDQEQKREPREKVSGIRVEVLEAYVSGGMGAVSEVLDRWNKKLGQVVYTLETAESWIEEKYPQGVDKDDGHDR